MGESDAANVVGRFALVISTGGLEADPARRHPFSHCVRPVLFDEAQANAHCNQVMASTLLSNFRQK
jgi:hypothetical protein